ncbi:Uncharacterised protein [Mycobacteroides abscessus subsp. abscessus]|nr:Uncharacterised protein [Mycobacteroides abscessus subsp. abscessus]
MNTNLTVAGRSVECPSFASTSVYTSSIDGTKCRTVIPREMINSRRYAGSRWPPGLAITSRAPRPRAQSNSHTETSKVNGVL